MSTDKARYWILTIPHNGYTPWRPSGICYIRGQLERGDTTGYLHWQLLVVCSQQTRRAGICKIFGTGIHADPTRSSAANDYVWKEETRVEGTQFELGELPVSRGRDKDWAGIKEAAKSGRLDDIPADVYIRNYSALVKIRTDNLQPAALEREVCVFWGPTGTGKSRRAWSEAGLQAYPKDPCSKFWCGYRDQAHVVIDEFRGQIGISHVLRWFDRYPVCVEVKGSAVVLSATRIWITSNVDPRDWYPDLDQSTRDALLRRLTIIHCPIIMY